MIEKGNLVVRIHVYSQYLTDRGRSIDDRRAATINNNRANFFALTNASKYEDEEG